jgi:hypothetical protein
MFTFMRWSAFCRADLKLLQKCMPGSHFSDGYFTWTTISTQDVNWLNECLILYQGVGITTNEHMTHKVALK